MKLERMGSLRWVTQRQHGDGNRLCHLRECGQQLFGPKHPHIGRAQPQISGLEHDLRSYNRRIDFAMVFAVCFLFQEIVAS